MAGKLRGGFDHGYLRAKPAHRLRELQPHVAAAQHDEVFGQSLEVESLHVRHRDGGPESWNFRHSRA